jgi:hypothetical protein
LALGGQHFEGKHNNQIGVGGRGGRDAGEEARMVWSVWGDIIASIWAAIQRTKKPKILYTVALDGGWSINLHTTTNQKQAPIMEESSERRQDYRGAWGGGCKSIVLAAIEWGVHIKTKIIVEFTN